MKQSRLSGTLSVAAALAAILCLSMPAAQAEEKPAKAPARASKAVKKSVPPTEQAEGRKIVASGAAEDSQSDCTARIPKDATAGQRLLAEQSCARDQSVRQPLHNTPGR